MFCCGLAHWTNECLILNNLSIYLQVIAPDVPLKYMPLSIYFYHSDTFTICIYGEVSIDEKIWGAGNSIAMMGR